MDIFSLIILFGVISMIVRFIKKVSQTSKNAQTQAEVEATKPRVAPKPAPKREDYRFPSVKKSTMKPAPAFQEGGDPNAVMGTYTPISPSSDLKKQFSNYQGSLDTSSAEGAGYQAEAYDPVEVPYRTDQGAIAQVLPKRFNRDALLQAVVMSEVLKRPGAER